MKRLLGSSQSRLIFGGAAALIILVIGGCASPGGISGTNLFAGSEKAEIKKAVAKDSFPSAAEAGIASCASNK